jgi:phage-related protein
MADFTGVKEQFEQQLASIKSEQSSPDPKVEAQKKLDAAVKKISKASPSERMAKTAGDSCTLFDGVGSLISGPAEAIGSAADAVGDVVGGVAGGVEDAAGAAASAAGDLVGGAVGGAKDAIGQLMGPIADLGSEFDSSLEQIKNLTSGLAGASAEAIDVAADIVNGIADNVEGAMDVALEGVDDALGTAGDLLGEGLAAVGAAGCGSSAGAIENKGLEKAKELGVPVPDGVKIADLPSADRAAIAEELGGTLGKTLNLPAEGLANAASNLGNPGETMADVALNTVEKAKAGAADAVTKLPAAKSAISGSFGAGLGALGSIA